MSRWRRSASASRSRRTTSARLPARWPVVAVPVVLSGDGGDEMFGGYPTYRADRLAAVYRRVPRPLRYAVAILSTALPASTAKLSLDFRLRQFLAGVELDDV